MIQTVQLLCAACSVESVDGKKETGSLKNAERNTKEPQIDIRTATERKNQKRVREESKVTLKIRKQVQENISKYLNLSRSPVSTV